MAHLLLPRDTQTAVGGDIPRVGNLLMRLYGFASDDLIRNEPPRVKGQDPPRLRVYSNIAKGTGLLPKRAFGALAERQRRLLDHFPEHLRIGTPCFELASNFTCGMSEPTLLQNGLTLLRPYGIPIITAAAVKGIMSAWLSEILAGELNLKSAVRDTQLKDAGLLWLFGYDAQDDGDSGSAALITFDALMIAGALAVDVTTVHRQDWYSEGKPPAGFNNPVPIPFITVARQSRFQFALALRKEVALDLSAYGKRLELFGITALSDTKEFVVELLKSTARYKGFGSQTALGYGRKEPCQYRTTCRTRSIASSRPAGT
jgi:CRISPR type III-B/RAMP module RAMP protein Cmr6